MGKANADAEKFIKDLGKFDSKGEAFRYPETKGGDEYCKKISQADGWLYERLTAFDEFVDIAKKVIGQKALKRILTSLKRISKNN